MDKVSQHDGSRRHLGEKSDIAAVDALVSLTGKTLVDVGCGPGMLAIELCKRDAAVIAVEPDPIQAGKNRAAATVPGLTFIEARAEALPLTSGSIDGVFFFRSLHHVPVEQMDAALTEAARILKPVTGFLCVVEPAVTGSHFAMMRRFHDETRVRHEAQRALERTAGMLFRNAHRFDYVQYPWYENFDAMATRIGGSTFNNIRRETIYTDEVRDLFEGGRIDGEGFVFDQPMLLNLYSDKRAA